MQEVIWWIRTLSIVSLAAIGLTISIALIAMVVEKWQMRRRYRIKRKWRKDGK